ncbi:hypothetical protein [Pantoea ananatis]|jgi:hypothetical protein|uniref:hypothetical protein n=1 Tax=Pantoea ananas TaxID=553 RepID=UPI00049738E5|nr:hypothetical protein [Pantoea ananatis]MDQ1223850.1 hypothetical protein [Pantoea ananatis]MDR6092621.1 hypothetical protein [Pantoea ananatis]NQE77616.1 hypothetical protein [Pantoea ananatis]NQE82159.1 hypothetical protein [Pantoea ananatis]PQK82551.1 hypothetical protein CG432_23110 [Pantoea ananatis]
MKNGHISFSTLYEIMRDYFTDALPHPVSKESADIVDSHIGKVKSGFMVSRPGLTVVVKAQPTAEIDAALIKDETATALDGDIVVMVRWLIVNGYLELDTSGNAYCRATDKMLQVKTLQV